MDPLLRLAIVLWATPFLLVAVLLIGARIAARIQFRRQLLSYYATLDRNQAAIRAALAQEAREKELLELLATDPEPDCLHDLVGCILCRFDLAGHEEPTP